MVIETIDLLQMAGDIDGDGIVNATDLTYLLSEFGKFPLNFPYADIDGDGIVNATDLTYLLAGFGKKNVVIEKNE
jgi:Ca2+-binding EF-hand superfamily protein